MERLDSLTSESQNHEELLVPPALSLPRGLSVGENKSYLEPFPITECEAKEALMREVCKHPTWKKSVIKSMNILKIESTTAYHYVLETFCEMRSTSQATEAYLGQSLDSLAFAVPPDPWAVTCLPDEMFANDVKHLELPYTSTVATCKSCKGQGTGACVFCNGSGLNCCTICNGTGMKAGIPHPNQTLASPPSAPFGSPYSSGSASFGLPSASFGMRRQPFYPSPNPMSPYHSLRGPAAVGIPPNEWCWFCKGLGSKPCTHCKGKGVQDCRRCSGSGQIRNFQRLTVKFNVDMSEFLYETSSIPSEKFKEAGGFIVLQESLPMVLPLKNHPIPIINEQSKRLILEHSQRAIGQSRIILQRQTLRAIPVTCIFYELGHGRTRSFWVYGEDRRIFIKSYPGKCVLL